MFRPFPLAAALCVLTTALAALVPAPAAGAAPATPMQQVPIVRIAPQVNGLAVDGFEYRVLQTRYNGIASALSTAKNTVASSASELTNLQLDDARLTTELHDATERKKNAVVGLARARAGLRTLAITSYVNGRAADVDDVDLAVATEALGATALTDVVSTRQVSKLKSSAADLDDAERVITTTLGSRVSTRARIAVVQATHDQAVQDEARLTQDLVNEENDLERARVTATVVGEDFALVAVDAYWKAAAAMASDDPACGIPWWALAGITRSESRHGTYGGARLLANGDVDRRIIGIPLDGTNNTAVIGDTDGGAYDGDTVYDRAVGPMQFIPSTWRRWAQDGNGDGRADPNNIYDAALAAAHYLCATGPMRTDDDMRRGFYSYNHSDAYANTVLNYAKGYSRLQL